MPPRSNRPQQGDTKQLQFIDIDDFTAGLYSNSSIAFSAPPNTQPGPFPAPGPGAGDASATWQCIALPGGGLGPLPGVIATFDLLALGITDPPSLGYIAGWKITDVSLNDEVIVVVEYQSGGDNHVRVWEGTFLAGGGNLLYSLDQATPSGGGVSGSPYPFMTRVAPSSPTTTVGEIVVAIPISDNGDIILYPDPASPGSIGIFDFTVTGAQIAFGHQNRIVTLVGETLTWPIATAANANTDGINYTDPPNSEVYPGTTPDTIFVAEFPFGYGAVGSISAGELFMVKERGGGVVIQGDINNPTVTFLPGVRPTGPIYGHADSNEAGFFYCCQNNGAHLWGGGSTSQKISTQLDDNFFVPTNVVPSRFFNYFCKRWDRYMLFSNNWMFDQQTGGWWRLLNPSTASLFGYDEAFNINQFYANINEIADDTTVCFYQFDKTVPASLWQWQSLPIRVSEDRLVDFREVQVRYSNPYAGSGTFTMTVDAIDSAGNVVASASGPFTWASAVNRPQMQRFNIDCKSEDLTVRISVQANTFGQPAPVIHSLSLGYRTREHAGPTE